METSSTPRKDNPLVDPATVSVIGAVNEQGILQSPSDSEPLGKKPKKDKPTTSKAKAGSDKSVKSESKSATETKIAELDQKWSDRFNRMEALLMARTLEPTFSTVKVTPTHSPPAGAVKTTDPFMKVTTVSSSEFPGTASSAVKHQSTSKTQADPGSTSSDRSGADFSAAKHQSTSKLQSSRPHTDRPKSSDLTHSPVEQKHSRTGQKSRIPGFLQPTFLGPKAKQPMETHTRSEQSKPIPQGEEIQNGNTGNHQIVPPRRGVGHLSRL